MKKCAVCHMPFEDGGLIVHRSCLSTSAKVRREVLDEVELRILALPDGAPYMQKAAGVSDDYDALMQLIADAAFQMGIAMALNCVKDMQAVLDGCTLQLDLMPEVSNAR